MYALILEQLSQALRTSWSRNTSYLPDEWSIDNPARGQCVVSALIIQDYLRGDFNRYHVVGNGIDEIHYCNVLKYGTIVDSTRAQYAESVTFKLTPVDLKNFTSVRNKLLSDAGTKSRYELLKNRVASHLETNLRNK